MTQKKLLNTFFHPRSIAVIGASRHPEKLGARVFSALQKAGFSGTLYPVHPEATEVGGHKAYSSITDIPGHVDLAVIVTPAATVCDLVEACAKKGTRDIIVISAGFKEAGSEGVLRERELRDLVLRYKLNLLGPNCLGYAHGDFGINASFGPSLPKGGNIALISQSGAMAVALTDWAVQHNVVFRSTVSIGNKAGLDEVDVLEYFSRDPKTKVIALYLESLEHGAQFLAAAKKVSSRKPVFLLKAGETATAQRAVSFHTGALAGDEDVLEAAMREAGVTLSHTMGSFQQHLLLAAHNIALPNRPVTIVTNAGGPGILATDAAGRNSIALASLTPQTRSLLQKILPQAASTANPIDIVGDADPERFRKTVRILAKASETTTMLVLLTPQVMTEPLNVARVLVQVAKQYPKKHFVAAFLGGALVGKARTLLTDAGIPNFETPEEAMRAIKAFQKTTGAILSFKKHNQIHVPVMQRQAERLLLPPYAGQIMQGAGILLPRSAFAQDIATVLTKTKTFHFPVVAKRIEPAMVHKTEKKAVITKIQSHNELTKTLRSMHRQFSSRSTTESGWLVQEQTHGQEVFLGAKRDPAFGPVVLLGAGGVDAEMIHRTALLLAPFTEAHLRSQLEHYPKVLAWLTKRRSQEPLDLQQILEPAARLGMLLEVCPEILEVDINPLVVPFGKKALAADIRIRTQA